ncbi:response regulator [Spirosoma sp. SC4-14]|uniref:response regulator n=1 Tax=Spirosoma sp. SC4-14 TaxID=3128900 RepID=UPI0030CE3DDD
MSVGKSPWVWVVDDDQDDQYLFELAFKRIIPPVQVKLLDDGEELLPALVQTTELPDLIILDLNMPRLNGLETLQQIRQQPDYQKIPIVVLTTSTRKEDKEKAVQLGANGFLTKPPSLDAILALFRQLILEWRL